MHQADQPQIALEYNGNAIAVWREYDGSVDSIWANRDVAGKGWGTEQHMEVSNAVGHSAYDPQIALDSNGNAIAVWRQYDGSVDSIWANRYVAERRWGV